MQDVQVIAVWSSYYLCIAAVPSRQLAAGVARSAPQLAAYRLGLIPGTAAKSSLLAAFFRGVDEGDLRRRATDWAVCELPSLVRPGALDRLRWHRDRDHRVVVVSASLEIFLRPWATSVGIGDVLATRLESRDGRLTGQIEGRNCQGQEKVDRLRSLVGDLANVELYVYGDSRGDRELLGLAHHGFYRPFRGGR